MHINTINAIKKYHSSFNFNEVIKFFKTEKSKRQTPFRTLERIKNFYTRFEYSCEKLTHKELYDIHERLCDRFNYITHPSVIDKSLYDIFAKTPEESEYFYSEMCNDKIAKAIKISNENPDFRKVGDKDALIRRYGVECGTELYENFRQTQRNASKRSLQYWLGIGLSEEHAKEELRKFQTKFSLSICIEKYGKEEGIEVWKDRQDRWQSTLNSKSDEEKEEINKKKSRGADSSRYTNDNTAIIYLIRLPNKHLKIGITNKNSIYNRYKELELQDCEIVFNKKYVGSIASVIESMVKDNYFDNIIDKSEQIYPQFGYTETIKDICPNSVICYIEETYLYIQSMYI